MQNIEIFTDGSATTADKPGGYGWVLVVDEKFHSEGSGRVENVTNNDMELFGAIQGLTAANQLIKDTLKGVFNTPLVTLCSDSQLVLGWASGEYRFKQEQKMDKYVLLKQLMAQLNAKTKWVKGHSGNLWNERCDKLANKARLKSQDPLDKESELVDTRIGTKKNGVVSLWYQGELKIVDFEQGIVENYNRNAHGKRGSIIEIRESKDR